VSFDPFDNPCLFHLIPCPNSPTYLALYRVSREVLTSNLDAIRRGIAAIMGEIAPLIDATETEAA